MKRLLTILPILSLLVAGCYREPFAEALISPDPAYVGEDVHFDNLSANTKSVEWDFDDGVISTDFNAVHFFEYPGFYNIKLRAFGERNDADVVTYSIEVIGSSIKIIVKDNVTEALIPGASVLLYPTLQDWDDQTNASIEYFTNNYGELIISDLAFKHYYVDVWVSDTYNNWGLGLASVDWIETQLLTGIDDHTFLAYIDIYVPGKKSTSGTRQRPDHIKAGPKGKDPNFLLKKNKLSVPKKK